jgi:pimeloyl-ACP methyl ester carboxylesterase
MAPASMQVLSSDNAQSGAVQLVDFLTGITATRDWDAGQNLSVIGHSYGTTTASLALAETPVENFTMLGSAGIDESIPHVSDLQVDADNVWASEAEGDWVADLGRGELTPWGSTWDPLNAFEHQVDPTTPDYGANVFSSEAATYLGEQYLASDGHESTPQLDAQLDDSWSSDTAYGYLDWGTNPLLLSSMLSLGLTDEVVAVGTPSGGGSGR